MLKLALLCAFGGEGGERGGGGGDVEGGAGALAMEEGGTKTWYAFAEGPGHYGIFDTFEDEAGRQAHLDGPIAKILMAKAEELFSEAAGDS